MPPIPRTMKAIQITETGGPSILQLKDVPVPEPSASQVLVKNEFSGVNYIDTYFRTGLYPAQLPIILGREAAGTVVASQSSQVPVGTRVVYMGMGTYAQYSAVELSSVIQIPEDLSTEKAVAVYLQGLTAWTLIKEAANVQKGQWTLVHAAAGGVGLLLVQMLRSIGAKVIGTASTEEKRELAKTKGAEWTIDSGEDVVAKVKEITGGHGIDAIFDGVGMATFDADLEMIAPKGHLVSFGNASGAVPPVNILKLGAKNVKLVRPVLYGYITERKDLEAYSQELFTLVASGKLDVVIHDVYPLSEVARAHVDIESRKTTGKLLIRCE
ncbi:hypothetical protein E4U22_008434 [Claviceps purpurea]|uniref:Probable quinone oxidoreductase n=2 Tax=Claviceps TaxID=5110 RepID=M1W4B8_CLAP2|nr:hypothetical protein E4U12_005739 [Claviceps purpurea]KAG6299561.1 hypothetical protein E4U09_008063 [Claviceps aff. purpurea]CCE26598.1 related to NADPH2:quinone reductase [Claviceps purpurea 20.1]KAG6171642.1 hypothetical protein E4U11_008282 [Claviceps purpurea]KAG6190058.1 hypothetical protein E4U36_003751 [Claviceps purpurea]